MGEEAQMEGNADDDSISKLTGPLASLPRS